LIEIFVHICIEIKLEEGQNCTIFTKIGIKLRQN